MLSTLRRIQILKTRLDKQCNPKSGTIQCGKVCRKPANCKQGKGIAKGGSLATIKKVEQPVSQSSEQTGTPIKKPKKPRLTSLAHPDKNAALKNKKGTPAYQKALDDYNQKREKNQVKQSEYEAANQEYSAAQSLNLSTVPSAQQLKSAYRKAATATHPDRGGSAEAFQAVNNAYEFLKKRYRFDSLARWDALARLDGLSVLF